MIKSTLSFERYLSGLNLTNCHLLLKKQNFMIFTNNKFKKLSQPYKVNIDGINVEQVTDAKFLGIIVTQNVSWDSHIKTIKIK